MAMKKPKYDYLLKLIIIGDSSVGKTCLLLRFSDDQFPTSHMPTIGIDFRIKTINIMNKNLWDKKVRPSESKVNPILFHD